MTGLLVLVKVTGTFTSGDPSSDTARVRRESSQPSPAPSPEYRYRHRLNVDMFRYYIDIRA